MKSSSVGYYFVVLLACGCQGLIIPEELPSILSIIYSNIPPIKNGFDTRFGVGFRLGQHADVQLVTEIGPQIETQALGETAERRRHAQDPPAQSNRIRPVRTQKHKARPIQQEYIPDQEVESEPLHQPEPNSWLAQWHRAAVKQYSQGQQDDLDDQEVKPEGVDLPVLSHLKKLYKNQPQ